MYAFTSLNYSLLYAERPPVLQELDYASKDVFRGDLGYDVLHPEAGTPRVNGDCDCGVGLGKDDDFMNLVCCKLVMAEVRPGEYHMSEFVACLYP